MVVEFISCSFLVGLLSAIIFIIYLATNMINFKKKSGKGWMNIKNENLKYDKKIKNIIKKAENAEFEELDDVEEKDL